MAKKAAKKVIITNIILSNGTSYTVNQVPAHFGEEGAVVVGIALNRAENSYNKGFQVPGASYTVSFESAENGDKIVRVVPFSKVEDVGIAIVALEDDSIPVPELPED